MSIRMIGKTVEKNGEMWQASNYPFSAFIRENNPQSSYKLHGEAYFLGIRLCCLGQDLGMEESLAAELDGSVKEFLISLKAWLNKPDWY